MSQDNIWLQGRRREAASLEAIVTALQNHPGTQAGPDPAATPGAPAPRQAIRGAGVAARTAQAAARASRPGTSGASA